VTIIEGLKKRLYHENSKKGEKWIHELPHVIWGLRTQPYKATVQTPFFLIYGSEAILPADIMWKSPRVEMYDEGEVDEARQLELDYVEEARCTALVQSARYLQGIRRYHVRNVRERSFNIGDLVLRRIQDESGLHKLGGPIRRQAGYKTGIISTTISRGPRCSELLEYLKPAQVLPMRKCSKMADLRALRWSFSLPNQIGGLAPQNLDCKFLCEHTKATATCMFYINQLLVARLTEATATSLLYRLLAMTLVGRS
jgi:hypothetical protein